MFNKKEIWNNFIKSVELDTSKSELKTWFFNTKLIQLETDLAVIEAPNKFIASWLSTNYTGQIQNHFKKKLNFIPIIRFTNKKPSKNTPYHITQKKYAGSVHQLNHLWTFNNFIKANCNRFAYFSALEVGNNPGTLYNPLYIYSKSSSGKTHLLNAIGNHILNNNPFIKVKYISADQFLSDYSQEKLNNNLSQFLNGYRYIDLFLFDNIHELSGCKKSQKELISIFNLCYDSKKQIVITGKSPPGHLPDFLSELKSRLEWGLISEIKEPDQKTKIFIIKQKATDINIRIPDDVAFFMANNSDNLKTLMQHIVSLETYSSLYKREIDISAIKSIIKKRSLNKINVPEIQKFTSIHFNVSINDLLSNKKSRKFSLPRQIAMYLSRKLTNLSYKKIGEYFADRDHSTVIYAVKHIEKEIDHNISISQDINKIQSLFL